MAKFSENLDLLIKGIDQQLAALNSLRPLKSTDEERLWKKFRLEWSYNSNHIEGNTLTYGETQLLLLFDQTTPNHHFRELEEMKAHDVAVALVKQWAEEKTRELTEADIRSLNETILVRPYWKEAMTSGGQSTRRLIDVGEYKKHPNSVLLANGEMFHYTEPAEVPREMAALMEWYRTEGALLHPVVTSALFHYRFVRVHPFDDGNGRMARLLMNYHLMRHGLPPVIIPSIDKQNYLFALQRADVGDLEAFVVYIGEQLSRSLEWSIRAGRGESVEEHDDWAKEIELLYRQSKTGKNELYEKRLDTQKALAKWLQLNIPTIWNEFERCFKPFDVFFREVVCDIYMLSKWETVAVGIQPEKENWQELVTQIADKELLPTIYLSYRGKGFLYPKEGNETGPEPVKLALKLSFDTAQLAAATWPISPLAPVTTAELGIIKESAGRLKAQIEAALPQ